MATVGAGERTSSSHRSRGAPSSNSSQSAILNLLAQSSNVQSHRHQTVVGELTIEELKKKTELTDDLLDQPIPDNSLFDIAILIPNWSDYAGSQGMELSKGEIQTVREDTSCTTTRINAQRALEMWHSRDPNKATYRRLLNMCLKRKHGDIAIKIVNEVILASVEEVDAPISPSVATTVATTTAHRSTPESESESLYKHVDSQEKLQDTAGKVFDETQLASKTLDIMKKDFGILYSSLRRALKKQDVSASDLLSHLRDMETFGPETDPIITSQHCTLRIAMDTTVKRSPTVDDVFHLMAPYCSWFNHLLIDSIVEVFFEDDTSHLIHRKLQNFKQKFNDYCQTRHFPLEYFGSDEVHGTTPIVFKIDHHWESIQVGQLINVRTALAAALKIRQVNLLLRTVRNGCLELTVAMPTHVARELFPLPENTILPLNDHKIISFKYEQYSCNVQETARELMAMGDKVDRQINEELRQSFMDKRFSPGELAGMMMAQVGRRIADECFLFPAESILISIAGGIIQFSCFAVPYYMNTNVNLRVMAGIFGCLSSVGLTYYSQRKYPHNIFVRHRATLDLYFTVGTLVGTLVSIHDRLGVQVCLVLLNSRLLHVSALL